MENTQMIGDQGNGVLPIGGLAGEALSGGVENDRAVVGSNSDNSPEALRKKFQATVRSLGSASGEGASALPRLALTVVRAAADGLISTDKPKNGSKDDATLIYEAYTAADSKKAEHTLGGAKANASKLRQLIALGSMTTCDGVEVADRAISLHKEMVAAELKPKPVYAGLVDVARAQTESDTPLTDDQVKEALTKTPAEKTVEKEWQRALKIVEGLITGENPAGLKDQSAEAIEIQEKMGAYVKAFGIAADHEAFITTLMERGYSRSQAEHIAEGSATAGDGSME